MAERAKGGRVKGRTLRVGSEPGVLCTYYLPTTAGVVLSATDTRRMLAARKADG